MNIVFSKAINNCDLLWKGTICSNCMTFKGKRPSTEMTWDVSGLLKGMCVDLYVVENSACAHLVPVSYCVQPWAEGSQLIFHWKINDEISLSFFPPSLSLSLCIILQILVLETRQGWLISCPSRKCMLLPPQRLPGLHIFKKGLKGLCGSLSSSCPLCRWGGCWLGPVEMGACREGVFLSCKRGDNRKREDSTYIRCKKILWVHVYLPHGTVAS